MSTVVSFPKCDPTQVCLSQLLHLDATLVPVSTASPQARARKWQARLAVSRAMHEPPHGQLLKASEGLCDSVLQTHTGAETIKDYG